VQVRVSGLVVQGGALVYTTGAAVYTLPIEGGAPSELQRAGDGAATTLELLRDESSVLVREGLDWWRYPDAGGGARALEVPFGYAELVARIRAVLRRAESKADLNVTKNVKVSDDPFDFVGARISPIRLEITFPDGTTRKLGRKELGILAYLSEHRGVVIPRKALIHSVWGIHADVRSRSLDQYIVKVRELFQEHGIKLDCFRTVHGVGYMFDADGIAPTSPPASSE
jgi:hypothetical protein